MARWFDALFDVTYHLAWSLSAFIALLGSVVPEAPATTPAALHATRPTQDR